MAKKAIKPKRPRGAPPGSGSIRTKAIDAEICKRLANGEPLAEICRRKGMPAYRTVRDWRDSDPGFDANIARAREDGEDVIASGCLRIADNTKENPNSRKVRIWTRLQLLAKWNPKKYGEKVAVGGDPDAPPIATSLAISFVKP